MKTTDVYSSHSTNWPVVVVTVVLAVPLLGLSHPAGGPPVGAAWVVALLAILTVLVLGVLTATSLRVTVGQGGVTARFGTLRLPRFRYPIESIAGARPATIRPWATPGIFWTHRDGLRLALRGGPAIRLTLHSGRRVTVGVENAELALTALERAGVTDVVS
jgi:hypothetical protein